MTKEYHEFFETKKKGNYKISEIDKKIESTIKKITGNEVIVSNKEILDRALMWGSLKLYLNDKNFSKIEQEQFILKFGEEKTNKILSLLKISNLDMLDKKVESAFFEASNLLEDDKNYLIKELEIIKEKSEGENIKKNKILKKILNYLK